MSEDISAVSVIMSVHNGTAYLQKAVESVLNQSTREFEFIIIDDGSTDGSAEILERFCKKDSRVRLIRQKNIGLTKSLNIGLRHARGEFIARMDGDDLCFPHRFATQLDFLRQNPDVVACGSNVELIDSDGDRIGVYRRPQTHEEIEEHFWSGLAGAIVHPSAMIRADALKKIGGYNEKFSKCQDYDLWFRLAEIGRLANVPQVLLQWRQHTNSICYQSSDVQFVLAQEIYYDAARRRGLDIENLPAKANFVRQNAWDCHVEWAKFALHEQNFRTARKHAKMGLEGMPRNSPDYREMCAIRNASQILKFLMQRLIGRIYWLFVKIFRRLKSIYRSGISSLEALFA
jgi:glycosyltransferase involved in cell wall biosynthesis